MTYQRDPDQAPDEAYEPGELALLVPGNRGRMLDGRRTPIAVRGLDPGTGTWELEVLAFEDAGARWVVELEQVDHFQFDRGASRLDGPTEANLRAALERFDRPLRIAVDRTARRRTLRRLVDEERAAGATLPSGGLVVDLGSRTGDRASQDWLEGYLGERGVGDVEAAFAERFVSNPSSGELVKGHRIVLAGLGLAPYEGKIVRDPRTFEGPWSEARRAEHVLARLGAVRALFRSAGYDTVRLWRGISSEDELRRHPARTFVSTTFDRAVAESLFAGGPAARVAALYRQDVPIERLFMTYVETAAMNRQFHEAEAVLLAEPRNLAF
jgi:hypothetical protein